MFVESWIEESARELGVSYRQLDRPDAQRVWRDVEDRYSDASGRNSLFDRLADSVSAYAPDGWLQLPKLLDASPVLVLVVDGDRLKVFEFADAADVVLVLGNAPGFEFYAVPEDLSALVCHNHHDYLIADGDARGRFAALGL